MTEGRVYEIASHLDWGVDYRTEKLSTEDTVETCWCFSWCSPAGQDFFFEIQVPKGDIEQLVKELRKYVEGFDVSYETYIWLDSSGHGKNGAPDDMKDCYEDMQACLDHTEELLNVLQNELDKE